MKCKNCGFDNMEGANFCIECGTKLEQEPDVMEVEYTEEDQPFAASFSSDSQPDQSIEPKTALEPGQTEDWMAPSMTQTIAAGHSAQTDQNLSDGFQNTAVFLEETFETDGPVSSLDASLDILDDAPAKGQGEPEAQGQMWYYMDGEAPVGPFGVDEMFEKLQDGVIDRNTYVWARGLADWIRLSQAPFTQNTTPVQNPAPAAASAPRAAQSANFSGGQSFGSYSQSVYGGQAMEPQQSSGTYAHPVGGGQAAAQAQPAQHENNAADAVSTTQAKSAVQWFCVQDSRSTGPYSSEVIAQMLHDKTINGNTYVWKEGMADWEYLRDTELSSLLPGGNSAPYWNGAPEAARAASYSNEGGSAGIGLVKVKSIALFILLSLVTCGIWYYVWLYQAAKDINELASRQNKPKGCDPVLAVILSLLTCGLYSIYYFYKEGSTLAQLNYPGYHIENQAVLLAVLGLFIPIASLAILQDQINSVVRYGS